MHQQAVEERGLVGELQILGARREPARDQAAGRGADALVAEAVERVVDLGDQVRRMHDLDAGHSICGAVDFQRAVEIERDVPVAAHERERLPFQRCE